MTKVVTSIFLTFFPFLPTFTQITVLKEDLKVEFSGQKLELTRVRFFSEAVYRVDTEEGAHVLREQQLPQAIDPRFINQAPPAYNFEFFISDMKVESFKVEEKSRFDRWVERSTAQSFTYHEILTDPERGYTNYQVVHYKLPPIKKGDIIRITYQWSAPLLGNLHQLASNIIYHHGKYPKNQHNLEIVYPRFMPLEIQYINGNAPHQYYEDHKHRIHEEWNYTHLPPSLGEPNSKPYEELPHLRFLLRIIGPYLQFGLFSSPVDWPIGYLAFTPRNTRLYEDEMSIRVGSTSRQYTMLNRYIATHGFDSTQQSPFRQLTHIHNQIASSYTYMDDQDVYRNQTMFFPKLGDGLLRQEFHDLMRYRAYSAILHKLQLDFSFAVTCHRFHGRPHIDYLVPQLTSDYLFAIPDSAGNLHFLYPKSQQCGYFMDELPFFFHDTEMLLLPWFNPMDIRSTNKDQPPPKTRTVPSPRSNTEQNTRTVNTHVTIRDDSLHVQVQMILQGQFSTLMRPLYLCDDTTTGVNPQYNRYLWESQKTARIINREATVLTTRQPYSTSVSATYKIPLQQASRGETSIPLADLVRHIYEVQLDTHRSLAYYSDFTHHDRFNIRIETTAPITAASLPESIFVQNDYGTYQLQIVQSSPHTITILSDLVISALKMPAEDIRQVIRLNQALRELQYQSIKLTDSQ